MNKLLTAAVVFLTTALLASCGSTPKSNSYLTKFNSVNLDEEPVYARLAKTGENSYVYSEFSFTKQPNMVNLNTLTHTYKTSEEKCIKSVGMLPGKTDGRCDTDSASFRTSKVGATQLLANTFGNAIMGAVSGGLVLKSFYTEEFDEEEFVAALKQAESSMDRANFLRTVKKIKTGAQKKLNKEIEKFNANYESIKEQLPKNVKVNDSSGLLNTSPQVNAVMSQPISDVLDIPGDWNGISELQVKLTNNISSNLAEGQITVNCPKLNNFNYNVTGCGQMWRHDTKPSPAIITYNVESKKIHKFTVLPIIEDEFIKISTDTMGYLTFHNKTDKFLTVSNLSLYINKDITSKTNLNIELSPHAQKKKIMKLMDFTGYGARTKLIHVVEDNLSAKVDYGLAAKYKIVDTSKERTLYEMSTSSIVNLPTR